jgi:hypothetical protein
MTIMTSMSDRFPALIAKDVFDPAEVGIED